MAQRIYRGPVGRQPRTVTANIVGAVLPGILVKKVGTTLVPAVAADTEEDLMILGNSEFLGQDVDTAYADGDTAMGYVLEPKQQMQARLDAGNYTEGQALAASAAGNLGPAAAGSVVLAHFDGTPGAVVNATLNDVVVANAFVKS